MKPYLTHAVFGLLLIAFLRTDYADISSHLKTPYLLITATIWTTLLIPLLIMCLCTAAG